MFDFEKTGTGGSIILPMNTWEMECSSSLRSQEEEPEELPESASSGSNLILKKVVPVYLEKVANQASPIIARIVKNLTAKDASERHKEFAAQVTERFVQIPFMQRCTVIDHMENAVEMKRTSGSWRDNFIRDFETWEREANQRQEDKLYRKKQRNDELMQLVKTWISHYSPGADDEWIKVQHRVVTFSLQ
jgi:HD superfamily phosphohydrolase